MSTMYTLILLKPDTVDKGFSGKVITRFEEAGFRIRGCKMIRLSPELLREHYAHIAEKPFYPEVETFMKSVPVIALVLEAPHAIELIRKMIGHTEPRQALPGTIRGDFASTESYSISDSKSRSIRNLIHASDSVENASREISLWFSPKELYPNYKILHDFLIE